MECEEVRNRLADYLSGGLPDPVRAEWQRHVASCTACEEETDALRDLWARLGEIPAERADTVAMRARFDEMLDAQRPRVAASPAASVWDIAGAWIGLAWSRQPFIQAGVAAALLLVGVLAGRYVFAPAPQSSADLTELRRDLRDVREMLTLSLMQQPSATERLRGVGWSGQIDQPGGEIVTALLDTLMHDTNVNVRLASIYALKRFADQELVRRKTLESLPKQTSPLVQIALIDFVVESTGAESAAALRDISNNSMVDETVRMRAGAALQRLGAKS